MGDLEGLQKSACVVPTLAGLFWTGLQEFPDIEDPGGESGLTRLWEGYQ